MAIDPLTIAAIINGAVQIGAAGVGSWIGNRRRTEAEQIIDDKKTELNNWRDREMSSNFLDRADSQAALRQVRQNQKEQQEALATDAVKAGATDQAKVAAAAEANKQYASTVSQLAGIGAQHKDNVQAQHLRATQGLDNLKIQNLMDNSGIDNTLQGLATTGNSILQLFAK